MSDKGLLEIAQQLVVDRDFRERFLLAPGSVLAELGISAEAYQTLATVVPVLLVGSVALISVAEGGGGRESIPVGWGRM